MTVRSTPLPPPADQRAAQTVALAVCVVGIVLAAAGFTGRGTSATPVSAVWSVADAPPILGPAPRRSPPHRTAPPDLTARSGGARRWGLFKDPPGIVKLVY